MNELSSVLVGAGITAIAGLIGLIIAGKNEHRKWLRGERLKIYMEYLDSMFYYAGTRYKYHEVHNIEVMNRHYDVFSNAYPSFVGSRNVREAMREFVPAFLAKTREDQREGADEEMNARYETSLMALEIAFRRDLGIPARGLGLPTMLDSDPKAGVPTP